MDPLYELLAPYFDQPAPPTASPQTSHYLRRLSTLSLSGLTTTEPASLSHAAQSHLRALQALSKRSRRAVIASTWHWTQLTTLLPPLESHRAALERELPGLDRATRTFAATYDRGTAADADTVLDRRKRALLLDRNVDRVADVLELPTLLASTVATAQASAAGTSATATSYASVLDLHAHVKRLAARYPESALVRDVARQAETEMEKLATILVAALQSPQLKLAGAMRTVGWLRRVAPDLAEDGQTPVRPVASVQSLTLSTAAASDGALGTLFLVCRLRTLHHTLDALEPLRELAEQESARREQGTTGKLLQQHVSASALGSQSERYLKRYIEIFREHSFGIISMYKSIFPHDLPTPEPSPAASPAGPPAALASFAMHLTDLLVGTLRAYSGNISDAHALESLLTQVLYCAGSLGRLGADFGLTVALLEDEVCRGLGEDGVPGWEQVMKKHRVQASRLEVLARGVGATRNV